MKHPLLSVIIPTYNRREYLKEAIDSVLAQNYSPMEIIVVDDGSLDETESLMKDYPQILYFKKENEGLPGKSKHFGAQKAKGEYLAFLDSDDRWEKDKIQKQMEALLNNPQSILVASEALTLFGNELSQKKTGHYSVKRDGDVRFSLLLVNFILNSSVIVRKESYFQAGGFPQGKNRKIAEDYELWLKLSEIGAFQTLSLPLIHYRIHGQNLAGKRSEIYTYVEDVFRDFLPQSTLPWWKKRIAFLFLLGKKMLINLRT